MKNYLTALAIAMALTLPTTLDAQTQLVTTEFGTAVASLQEELLMCCLTDS